MDHLRATNLLEIHTIKSIYIRSSN